MKQKSIINKIKLFKFSWKYQGYGNVNCKTIKILTIGNVSIISWQRPNMYFDYYDFDLFDNGTSVLINTQKSFGNQTASLKVYNLQFNYE